MFSIPIHRLLRPAVVCTCFGAGWMLAPLFHSNPGTSTTAEEKTLTATVVPATQATDDQLLTRWEKDIKPMLEYYCFDCHGDGSHKGGLCLDDFKDLASIRADSKTWNHILSRVDYQLMPPADEEQPEPKEIDQLVSWIEDTVFPVYDNPRDPGPLPTRRMNRVEYQNTLADLLGVDIDVSGILPPDDSAHGFDNVNTALTISPSHIERYLKASDAALSKAVIIGPMADPVVNLDLNKAETQGHHRDGGVFLFTRSSAVINHHAELPGTYELTITAAASRAGSEHALLEVGHSDSSVTRFSIANPMHRPKRYTTKLKLNKGNNRLSLTFPNDHYDPDHPNPKMRDRNLMLHKVELKGPVNIPHRKPDSHHRIFQQRSPGTSDRSYTRQVLSRFAHRAFRRPVSNQEIDRYIQLAEKIATSSGEHGLEQGIRGAIQAMLVSPSHLFLNLPATDSSHGEITLITEHQLASRLSYFIWSSMPDSTLLKLADQGKLRSQLDQQITRMLQDPRAKELPLNFAGQWLQLRDLDAVSPDRKTFPQYTPKLRNSMRRETELFIEDIILRNHPLPDLLDAEHSFLNNTLAKHYSIPGVEGNHFRKVSLSGSHRRGILTHASILTLTSQPNRTSPVLRGKFVLENLLHITPPPPPPNLPPLEDSEQHGTKLSIRQQLELHREKPACASCHNLMDPIGFALENFNGLGIWQDQADGKAIDTSGQLITGEKLTGPADLLRVLANNKQDEFLHSITTKMLTYALGRGITRADRHHLETILADAAKDDYRAHALIRAIVHSAPFQHQRN